MATAPEWMDTAGSLAGLLGELGNIPVERIRIPPALGSATEEDVVAALEAPRKRLCELVDGVLVEKAMGTREGLLAAFIVHLLWKFLEEHDLGLALGADGLVRLKPGLVRIPDFCFISWDRLPAGKLPDEAIAGVVPDLAGEVLSEGNTRKEMDRKVQDYFAAGVRLVWLVNPRAQTTQVYTSLARSRNVSQDQPLLGGRVLPGFSMLLKDVLARTERRKRKSR